MNSRNFFAELKRRNVYKVAVAYAVIGWLVMQVAATIVPALHLPDGITSAVVVIILLGFPVALVIAWAFEMTPDGMKRTENVSPTEVIPQWSRRKFAAFIAVVAIIAAGFMGLHFWQDKAAPTVTAQGSNPVSSSVIPEKSIAVLPFENLSSDRENAYFTDGIQEEILTRLSKIADLKVISRTSTQKYKSAPTNLREIAGQLGVSKVLEGSIQKVADQVRISVQLINAANDSHLWAETYDRKLIDVFQVESDIAQKIAAALEARLTGREQHEIASAGTSNPEAYNSYLRGLGLSREDNYDSQRQSQLALEEAVRLDPSFAVAWALLARVRIGANLPTDKPSEREDAVRTALENALRLQPDLAEAQIAKGLYEQEMLGDFGRARQTLEKLLARWPNNSSVAEAVGMIALSQGDWKEGRHYLDQAIALNPRDLLLRREAASIRLSMRDFEDALRIFDEALVIWPDDPNLIANKAQVYQALGQLDAADKLLNRVQPRAKDQDAVLTLWYQAVLRRQYLTTIRSFQGFLESGNLPPPLHGIYLMALGNLQRFSGDKAGAATSFAKCIDELEAQLAKQPGHSTLLAMIAQARAGMDDCGRAGEEAGRAAADHAAIQDKRNGPFYEEIRARVQALCGDNEHAIPTLKRLLEISYSGAYGPPLTPALLRLDPYFDRLRSDPRFEELCNLPGK